MVICGTDKGTGPSDPEPRAVIVTLEQDTDIRLPTPANRKERQPGEPDDVEPEVAGESWGSVKIQIPQPDGMEHCSTDVGGREMTVNLAGMGGNLGVKVADAGDSYTNLVLREGVEKSRCGYPLVQCAKGVNVPGDDIDGSHVKKPSLLWDEFRSANDKHVMGIRGMDQGHVEAKVLW
jgi:hypothetical protein